MAEPITPETNPYPDTRGARVLWPVRPDGETRRARARRAFRGWARAVLGWAARPARLIPGLGAIGCSVAGAYLLWGLGVALLVAGAFCLLLDARTPRG